MGYYTRFELEVQPKPGIHFGEEWENIRDAVYDWTIPSYNMKLGYLTCNPDEMKWYDWHDDMTAASKEFPHILFILSGVGEEDHDQWRCYFLGGKSQHIKAKITFDEFDESKLQ